MEMDLVPALLTAVLIKKFIDYLRVLIPDRLEEKTLLPLSAGVGVLFALAASTDEAFGGLINIWGGMNLYTAPLASVIIYGIACGALGGVIHDWVKPSTPPHDSEGKVENHNITYGTISGGGVLPVSTGGNWHNQPVDPNEVGTVGPGLFTS